MIFSGSEDNLLKVWDMITWNEIQTVQEHSDCINSLSLGGDGKILVSASDDCRVILWRVTKLGLELIFTVKGHDAEVNDA